MQINIKEISKLLDIDEISAHIYLELLIHPELSINKLTAFSGKTIKEVRNSLNILLKKGFIMCTKNFQDKVVFQKKPLIQMEEKLEQDKQIINNLHKFILPQIQQRTELDIMKYEGWEGIRHVYTEILEEAIKTKENIYAFESNIIKSNIGKIFLNNYIERRMQNNIKAYVICPITKTDLAYKKNYDKKCTYVKLSNTIEIDANINIVGELVGIFSTDFPKGTLQRNRSEANTLRSIFKMLWEKIK